MSFFFGAAAASPRISGFIPSLNSPIQIEDTDYLHLITNGQSLSNGAETTPGLSNANVLGNVMLNGSHEVATQPSLTSFNLLTVPVEQKEAIVAPWANSLKKRIADELPSHPINTKTLVASSTGTGGRTVTQLTTTEYFKFTNAITWTKQIADNLVKTVSCPAITYMQGETENSGDVATYKTNLLAHFNKMRNDVKTMYGQANLPAIIVYQPKDPAQTYVTQAYYELINTYDWIIGAGNVYSVPYRGIHLDPNGSRMFGEMIAKAMFETIKNGVKFEPLRPVSFQVSGADLIITYNRNIILDEVSRGTSFDNLKGFQLSFNIQQSLAVSGNTVTITTNQANLAAYGTLNLVYTNGLIRDADTTLATTDYTDYVDPGVYSLATNHIVDGLGNVIYGQKYPLWNWSLEYFINIQ